MRDSIPRVVKIAICDVGGKSRGRNTLTRHMVCTPVITPGGGKPIKGSNYISTRPDADITEHSIAYCNF